VITESDRETPARYTGSLNSLEMSQNDPRQLVVPSYDRLLTMGLVIDHRWRIADPLCKTWGKRDVSQDNTTKHKF